MCDLGLNIRDFNPDIFYTFKCKFDESYKTNYHCHDFISMIFILSGHCSYNINDTIYSVNKGDMLVFNSGVYHGKIVNSGDEVVEMHVGFGNINIEGLPKNHLIDSVVCPVFNLFDYHQEFFKIFNEIFYEQKNNEPGSQLMLKINVMKLLVLFLRTTHTLSEPQNKSTPVNFESVDKVLIVNTMITYLNENYMHPISLDSISKNIYLSPAYISKVFKEETGESPINYLIEIRLAKARELLLSTKLSIKAIARTVGYEDVYHFSKLYKKHNNEPPSKVRKAVGEKPSV